jgi:uncharacterized protein YlxW (UPF0749 family)
LSKKAELGIENKNLMEILRTRLNVLNTSVFLLAEKLNDSDLKTSEYLKKINREMERIRKLITEVPIGQRDE